MNSAVPSARRVNTWLCIGAPSNDSPRPHHASRWSPMPAPDAAAAALQSFLIGPFAADNGPHCVVVKATGALPLDLSRLAQAADGVRPGDIVVYAIALEGSRRVRLLMHEMH